MTRSLRLFLDTTASLLNATFFVLTSVYFFLAHVPYTNFFLIQAPPYPWITWFGRTHSILYWVAFFMLIFQFRASLRNVRVRVVLASLAVIGLWLNISGALHHAASDWGSYAWGLAVLLPFSALQILRLKESVVPKEKMVAS